MNTTLTPDRTCAVESGKRVRDLRAIAVHGVRRCIREGIDVNHVSDLEGEERE
jgi:hypothetical protein